MKNCILLGLILTLMTLSVSAKDMAAYRLFDNSGKEISFDEMADSLGRADVVFFGENHNCPIAHWMELEVAKALFEKHGEKLVIGEEMLEADNQLILDEYMNRLIPYDRFEAEARLWDNYATDYYPVVFFAKDNGLRFVATNVPRRYAAAVNENGLEALDKLSDEAKSYLPPLPIPFKYDSEGSDDKFAAMRMLSRKSDEEMLRLAQAQALKDATMAWHIARNLTGPFLHINGSMHSDSRGGIIPYLRSLLPSARIATITSLRQEDITALDDWAGSGLADFYLVVPESFPTSY